jgi:hypothetical protein
MYFQKQHGLQCGLHAANNAVGAKVLIAADLNDAADEIACEMAVRAREAQQRRSTTAPVDVAALQARMRKMLVGPAGGQWAADCVVRALSKKGYHAHRCPVDDLAFQGSWLLFGDKFHWLTGPTLTPRRCAADCGWTPNPPRPCCCSTSSYPRPSAPGPRTSWTACLRGQPAYACAADRGAHRLNQRRVAALWRYGQGEEDARITRVHMEM